MTTPAAEPTERLLTYADVRRRASEYAWKKHKEWAGLPIPVEGLTLTVCDSFRARYPGIDTPIPRAGAPAHVDTAETIDEGDERIVNSWYCRKWSARVYVTRRASDGRARMLLDPETPEYKRLEYMANSIAACDVHDVEADMTALLALSKHVTREQHDRYLLLGMFAERSARSGVLYIFRRARPTIAIGRHKNGTGGRALCALCMHPIGYYGESYVGAMTPTDDVLAHLLLMRADEHLYWRRCNQHPIESPNAGV